jgi:hypothetical protein
MAILDDRSGTETVLDAARFLLGTLSGRRETLPLRDAVRELLRPLKDAHGAAEDAREAAVEKYGALVGADLDLDQRLRALELDLLRLVQKSRRDARYSSVFPKGLAKVLALRGAAEEREVKAVLQALRRVAPDLAESYGDLAELAVAATAAEREWLDAQTATSRLFTEEVVARLKLVRQIQKTEGALIALYPGQRARVRAFFRPARRAPKAKAAATPPSPA